MLTTYETIYLVLTAAGFIAVLLTLMVLVHQTALVRKSIEASICSSVGERQIDIDRIFLEWPALRKYFLCGVDIENQDVDYDLALAIAQLLANYFDTYFLQRRYPQLYSDDTWSKYIHDYLSQSPILRRFILEFSGWYTGDLVAAVKVNEPDVPAKGASGGKLSNGKTTSGSLIPGRVAASRKATKK